MAELINEKFGLSGFNSLYTSGRCTNTDFNTGTLIERICCHRLELVNTFDDLVRKKELLDSEIFITGQNYGRVNTCEHRLIWIKFLYISERCTNTDFNTGTLIERICFHRLKLVYTFDDLFRTKELLNSNLFCLVTGIDLDIFSNIYFCRYVEH